MEINQALMYTACYEERFAVGLGQLPGRMNSRAREQSHVSAYPRIPDINSGVRAVSGL